MRPCAGLCGGRLRMRRTVLATSPTLATGWNPFEFRYYYHLCARLGGSLYTAKTPTKGHLRRRQGRNRVERTIQHWVAHRKKRTLDGHLQSHLGLAVTKKLWRVLADFFLSLFHLGGRVIVVDSWSDIASWLAGQEACELILRVRTCQRGPATAMSCTRGARARRGRGVLRQGGLAPRASSGAGGGAGGQAGVVPGCCSAPKK